ncbi:MAG: hypothetical protein QGG67_08390 [Gammaproteobacteria bacterium]|jgi:hypothetical protein|nr:hypothetical protein [Gammaproteobacteria bacterium]MDP7456107.1 hypothetical protein [Gammaproteobacteria bacterium]|tara:strand:- start:114 stop:263 length:150 start_codon:yes stop_codon:yes gene_type:complete
MKFFKKRQNCLFVEEERHNWIAPKSSVNRRLIYLSILFVSAALLFGLLR